MLSTRLITLALLVAGLLTFTEAYSWSSSCIMKDGKKDCTSQNDPNGNIAAGGASIIGNQGEIAAGAGTPDNFNTKRQKIDYGDGSNGAPFDAPGYGGIPPNLGGNTQSNFGGGMPPNFDYGPNGVAVGSNSGSPPNFGPFFPNWNGDPFAFMQSFLRNQRRR